MKLSAIVLSVAATFASSYAMAENRQACGYDDYVTLAQALKGSKATIRAGAELADEIYAMLSEEMGPKCEQIIRTDVVGIPGDKFTNYEISGGDRLFKVNIVNRGVEGGYRTDVFLAKGN